MNRERLRAIFVARGFPLVERPDGVDDVPDYVYEALVDVITEVRHECAEVADARRPVLLEQAQRHPFGSAKHEELRAASAEARHIAQAIRTGQDAQQILSKIPTPKWSNG